MRLRGKEIHELARGGEVPLLAITVIGSALAMGGAIAAWFLPFGLLVCAYALLISFAPKQRRGVVWPSLIMIGLGSWSLVQALPLPLRWVTFLSPQAGDVWSRCLLPLGEKVSIGSLSLDPQASLIECLKWCSYGGAFYVAASIGRRRGAAAGLLIVFASAATVAVLSLAHAVFDATAVYGLYTPRNTHPTGLGPFLNPNNLAGYLNLGALVGLGLLLSRTAIVSRWLLGAGVLTIVAVALRTGSRGGVAALILGAVAFCTWVVLNRRDGIVSGRVAGIAISALFAVGGLFAFLGADASFWATLVNDNATKLRMTTWTIPIVRDYPLFGIGRGAFESVFFAYRPPAGNVAYTHPENFVTQWTAEWGVPVTAIAVGALIVALSPIRRGAFRSSMVMGAALGALVLLLQNLADLALELGAVSIALVTVLGSLWGSVRPTSAGGRPRPRAQWTPWLLRGGLSLGIVAGTYVAISGTSTLDEDRAHVRDLIAVAAKERSQASKERLQVTVVSMLKKHPAEYYFPLAGAVAARMRGETPMPWLQRALERGPTVGRTHLLVGDVLASRGLLNQGMLELQIGVGYEPGMAIYAGEIAVSHTQDANVLLRAVPDGQVGAVMLDSMSARLPETSGSARDILDSEALLRDETLVEPRRRMIERRLTALEKNEPLCADAVACGEIIEVHAAALSRISASHTLPARSRARLLHIQGRTAEATRLLATACDSPLERPACLQLRVEMLATQGAPEELNTAVDAYVDASCVDRQQCAAANDWVAHIRSSRGQTLQAVSALERAVREQPTAARWLKLADTAQQAGLNSTAVNALRQLLVLQGKDAAIEQRISELQRLGR